MGEDHLKGYSVALTKTMELTCERKGDPSKSKNNSVDKASEKHQERWQFYNVDDLPISVAADKPIICDKCCRAISKADETVKKLKEKIGSRKRICTVVQKEIGTQTETKVQRTIQTQTLYNIQEPNRNMQESRYWSMDIDPYKVRK